MIHLIAVWRVQKDAMQMDLAPAPTCATYHAEAA